MNGYEGNVMRKPGFMLIGAALSLATAGLMGCENTQGTSANPEITQESANYKNNDDPQNTGAGSGSIGKPPTGPTNSIGGESATQAAVKGTDTNNSVSLLPSSSPAIDVAKGSAKQ